MRASKAGFTLVEALVVVVVVGFMLVIALPRFNAMQRGMQVDGAAQQLAGDLRRAQSEALKRNTSILLVATGISSYTIDSIGPRSFDNGVVFGSGSSSGVRMASFGPPSAAATFVLQLGTLQKTVRVSGTGLVSVQ
jgi:type IV fimbrial biogenesis protein FimT